MDASAARKELDAFNAEISKLERLASDHEERPAAIHRQIDRTLLAQRSVGAVIPIPPTVTSRVADERCAARRPSAASPIEAADEPPPPPPPPRRTTALGRDGASTKASPARSGGNCAIPGDAGSGGGTDTLLEESLVALLSGEGWPVDAAIAAVKATRAVSGTAARNWLLHHQGGSGARGVRSLRRLQPATPTVPAADGPTPTLVAGHPCQDTARGATRHSPSRATLDSAAVAAASPRTVLPWLVPSPTKGGPGSVAVRVRVQGGAVVDISRRFDPTDTLRTVLFELLRQHPMDPAPPLPSLSLVITVPRRTFAWEQLQVTTLEAAGISPRGGVLILQCTA